MTSPYDILNNREKREDKYSYKLAPSKYGLDISIQEALELDESRMSLWIPYADGNRRDGVGDLLPVQGINTERHIKNAIVLFDHGKSVSLPIAMSWERDSITGKYDKNKYCNHIDSGLQKAKLNAFFYQGKGIDNVDREKEYDHAVFCEQLYHMAAIGMLQGGSIGYQVIAAEHLPPDYHKGLQQGLHLKSVLMLEGSLVVLPANMDTVMKTLSMPSMCGKRLSPYLVKSLESYAPEKKAQLGYEKKSEEVEEETNEDQSGAKETPHDSITGSNISNRTKRQSTEINRDIQGTKANRINQQSPSKKKSFCKFKAVNLDIPISKKAISKEDMEESERLMEDPEYIARGAAIGPNGHKGKPRVIPPQESAGHTKEQLDILNGGKKKSLKSLRILYRTKALYLMKSDPNKGKDPNVVQQTQGTEQQMRDEDNLKKDEAAERKLRGIGRHRGIRKGNTKSIDTHLKSLRMRYRQKSEDLRREYERELTHLRNTSGRVYNGDFYDIQGDAQVDERSGNLERHENYFVDQSAHNLRNEMMQRGFNQQEENERHNLVNEI